MGQHRIVRGRDRRAILGGVFALALLFGAAGLFVVIRGPGPVLGPTEADARGPERPPPKR